MYFIHLIRINYFTNLTYFPIFLYFVDFSKVTAASPLASRSCGRSAASRRTAAADRATVAPSINFVDWGLRIEDWGLRIENFSWWVFKFGFRVWLPVDHSRVGILYILNSFSHIKDFLTLHSFLVYFLLKQISVDQSRSSYFQNNHVWCRVCLISACGLGAAQLRRCLINFIFHYDHHRQV